MSVSEDKETDTGLGNKRLGNKKPDRFYIE